MAEKQNNLAEVASLFTKLGFIGFGGPAAHIAMMKQEVVHKRAWMTEEHFLDLIGATNLIPGPNSTEMALHIGHERAGLRGLVTAGLCFILPAVMITGTLAWLYRTYGALPQVRPFTYGIQAAILAVILGAIYPLARKSLKSIELGLIGLCCLLLSLFHFNEIYLLFGSGAIAMLIAGMRDDKWRSDISGFLPITMLQVPNTGLISISNLNLFLTFLKIGSILYGSGYVLFAFLDSELVSKGIISRSQLMDAIAVGQFTPGPVFSSVTFIGYQINGLSGAVVSTIAIFLPAFLFVALLNPLVRKMRGSKLFSVFLDAVNIASVAIIIAVCYEMGRSAIYDWRTILIALLSLAVTFSFSKLNSAFIVLGSSLIGYLLSLV